MNSNGIVNILDSNEKSIATGFFVSSNSYILTCCHVIADIKQYDRSNRINFKLCASSTVHSAFIESYDKEIDIALLHTSFETSFYYKLKSNVKSEERLHTIGFPNGSKIETYADPIFQDYINNKKLIQLREANAVTYGFSGAPLVTNEGYAVGMITSISKDKNFRQNNIAYAIPSSAIINAFSSYMGNEKSDQDFPTQNQPAENPNNTPSDKQNGIFINNTEKIQIFENSSIHGGIHFNEK